MKRFISLFTLLLSGACLISNAQSLKFIEQDVPACGIDCVSGSFAYFNGNSIYIPFPRTALVSTTRYPVSQLKISPDKKYVTAVCGDGKVSRVFTYTLKKEGELLFNPRFGFKPVSVCYSADAQNLAIADSEGGVHIMDSGFKTEKMSFKAEFVPSDMCWNTVKPLMALYAGGRLQLRSTDNGATVREFSFGGTINDAGFTPDGKSVAVLVSDGSLHIYDTDTFAESCHAEGLGTASSMALFPGNGYVAVATGSGTVSFVNPSTSASASEYVSEGKGITGIFPLTSFEGDPILCFVTPEGFWKDDISTFFAEK